LLVVPRIVWLRRIAARDGGIGAGARVAREQALGLTIPTPLLIAADEVIE
jgi:hypothetical protein